LFPFLLLQTLAVSRSFFCATFSFADLSHFTPIDGVIGAVEASAAVDAMLVERCRSVKTVIARLVEAIEKEQLTNEAVYDMVRKNAGERPTLRPRHIPVGLIRHLPWFAWDPHYLN
jgi:hypothetical protein